MTFGRKGILRAMSKSSLPPSVLAWQAAGQTRRIGGLDVFVVDAGPRTAAETVLVLHGFPSSSSDFRHCLPALTASDRRVILFDFPGFGLSAKPADHGYSLFEQADVAEQLVRELAAGAAVHLLAHDMGTSVACELLARRERALLGFEVRSLALMNGSVHIAMARLTPSQKLLLSPAGALFARFGSARLFKAQLRRILGRPVDEAELDDMWAQIVHADGHRRLAQTINYVRERYRHHGRWVGALDRSALPTLILWGPRDPVAVLAIAERLARDIPGATLQLLDGLGHYPQLEDPIAVSSALIDFWGRTAR